MNAKGAQGQVVGALELQMARRRIRVFLRTPLEPLLSSIWLDWIAGVMSM